MKKIITMMTNKWFILGFIVLVAIVLRFWQLGVVPASPDWDEAALGYNAYSILHTARDEYGAFLPPVLKSFGDYKPAFYAYLTIPSLLLFDLTLFAVRFPSAVMGVLTVIATYFFINELFKREDISLLSAALMAISPWSIQFSRVAFETNAGTACNLFAALFFVKGLKKPWLLSLSALFAALSLYVYQSEKVFTPLLILALVLFFAKDLWHVKKKFLVNAIVIGIIAILPMVTYIISDKSSLARVNSTLVFGNQTQFLTYDVQRLAQDRQQHDSIGLVFDNRRVLYAKAILSGYLAHFDLNWLFIEGDIARHHATNMGIMYLVSLPFLLFGIYALVFGRLPFETSKRSRWILLTWFLLAPIPASVTNGVPHAVRTMNFLPAIEVFVAVGIISFLGWVVTHAPVHFKKISLWAAIGAVTVVFLFNFAYYLDQYFVQYTYYDAAEWQYGYKQAIAQIEKVQGNYTHIIVSNKHPFDQSYVFFLFYLRYPPKEYQKEEKDIVTQQGEVRSFGKYIFRPINWEQDSQLTNTLFVGSPHDFPDAVKSLDIIDYPNGQPAVEIVGK